MASQRYEALGQNGQTTLKQRFKNYVDRSGDVETSEQKSFQTVYVVISFLATAFSLGWLVVKLYDDTQDGRLNVLNPDKFSVLSSTVYLLLPLLGVRCLYLLNRFYRLRYYDVSNLSGLTALEQSAQNSIYLEERIDLKVLRHLFSIALLVTSVAAYGLIAHDSPDYCPVGKDATHTATKAIAKDSNVDRHVHLKRCMVADLKDGNDHYGQEAITVILVTAIIAGVNRLIDLLLDFPNAKDISSPRMLTAEVGDDRTGNDNRSVGISLVYQTVLLTLSAGALIFSTIAESQDMNATDASGSRIIKTSELDWFIVAIVLSAAHTLLLGIGLLVRLMKGRAWCLDIEIITLNTIPWFRFLVVVLTTSALAYSLGMNVTEHVDYSFVVLALTCEVALDVFGRNIA